MAIKLSDPLRGDHHCDVVWWSELGGAARDVVDVVWWSRWSELGRAAQDMVDEARTWSKRMAMKSAVELLSN